MTVVGTPELPSELSYVEIRGRLLFAVTDTVVDSDINPDAKYPTGSIVFTAAPAMINISSANTLVYPSPITVTLTPEDEGYFRVGLLSTLDEDMTPNDWTYKVEVKIDGATTPAFNIKVPPLPVDSPVPYYEFTKLAPVTTTGGVAITKGDKGDKGDKGGKGDDGKSIVDIQSEGSTATVFMSDGSTIPMALPTSTVPGPAPEVTWSGTTIIVDGDPGPDLKGDKGDPGGAAATVAWVESEAEADALPPGTLAIILAPLGPDPGPDPDPEGVTPVGAALLTDRAPLLGALQWEQVEPLTPHPEYPGTVLDGDRLVMDADGIVTVSARIQFAGESTGLRGYRITRNGTVVHTDETSYGDPQNFHEGVTVQIVVQQGDLIGMEYRHHAGNVSTRRLMATGTRFHTTVIGDSGDPAEEGFIGKHLLTVGDSYSGADFHNTPGQRAAQILHRDLSTGVHTVRAVSGETVGDQASRLIGHLNTWVPGQADLVMIYVGLNDMKDQDSPHKRAALLNHYRALLTVLHHVEHIPSSTFTFDGDWITNGSTSPSRLGANHERRWKSGGDATARVTITEPGTYYLGAIGLDARGLVGGTLTVTQGETQIAVIDAFEQHFQTAGGVLLDNLPFGPMTVRLPGVQPGEITMTFSTEGRTNARFYLDGLYRMTDAGVPTVLSKLVPVTASSINRPSLMEYVNNEVIPTLADEFGSRVLVADPNPGWNTSTMLGADGVHPTDVGNAHLAQVWADAIRDAKW